MQKVKKGIMVALVGFLLLATAISCSNAVLRPRAGVDAVWGRHGPKAVPIVSVDVYGGGRY